MRLNKKSILGLFVLGVMLATGCSSDDKSSGGDVRTPISLSSRVDVTTRSTVQDTQIAKDGEVGIFVTKASAAAEQHYENEKLVANGMGDFSYSTLMYYPVNNENVDFYAYHPYQLNAILENVIDFTVKADQTDVADYLNSDLLWSIKENIAKSTNAVGLNFVHKLSKVNFTVKEGAGMDLSGLSDIEIMDAQTGVSLNLLTGEIIPLNNNHTPIKAYGVRGINDGEAEVNGISAIVVPQTFTLGSRLFKITISGGTAGEISYYYTPDKDVVLDSGKKYNYILTINHAGIEVTSTIEDWVDGGTTEGEGTID